MTARNKTSTKDYRAQDIHKILSRHVSDNAEERLWLTVIIQAVRDAVAPYVTVHRFVDGVRVARRYRNATVRDTAIEFLSGNMQPALAIGLEPEFVREMLMKCKITDQFGNFIDEGDKLVKQ